MFYYIFLFLVLLMPLRNIALKFPQFFGVSGLNITNILFGFVFLGIVLGRSSQNANTLINNQSERYQSKLVLPLILYVCYFLIQALVQPGFYSYEHQLVWWKDSFLFMLLVYLFISRTIVEPKKIIMILAVMCVANIYMDIYFWRWVRWINFDSFADKMKSVNGTFGDVGGCNEWAAFYSTYTLLMIAVSRNITRRWQNVCLKLLIIVNIFVLLFTFSRGGYAGFLIGFVYLIIKAKKYLMILVIVSLPLFYTFILPEAVVERIEMSFETTESGETADQDVESRLVMWQQSLAMIAEAPFIGHGLLSFRYNEWRNPHNQHLNIFVQGGVLGYALFIWLFIATYRDAHYLFRFGRDPFSRSFGLGMCAVTVSLCVANIFGDRWSYYILTGYFWILNGLVYILINQRGQLSNAAPAIVK